MSFIGHGGKEIVERVISSQREAKERIGGLKRVAVTGRVARECIDIAYGFFTPLEGFMDKADVEAVCKKMRLADGTVWSIPIVFDIANDKSEKEPYSSIRVYLLSGDKTEFDKFILNDTPKTELEIEEL